MPASRVLVTGAGGFIGSHLVEECVARGLSVRAFVHYNAGGRCGWLDTLPSNGDIEVVSGDVRDLDSVLDAAAGCDTIFHLAALIGIPYSYRSPLAYIRTNVGGTYNVLQAARTLSVGNVVVTSTSEVYGTAQFVPMDESHPLSAQSPYAATKIAADQLALSFHRSFGLPVRVVRPFNTYGPRQSVRAIIPTIITQVAFGKKEIKLGNLAPTRDLTYVKDTARAFLEIASCDDRLGKVTNVGMNEEISVGSLVSRIARLMGAEVSVIEEKQRLRPEGSEVYRLVCDNSAIQRTTSWRPLFTLDLGLSQTIEWVTRNLDTYKRDSYTV